jgi:hypothetical protein
MRKEQVQSFIELIAVLRKSGIQSEYVAIPLPWAGLRFVVYLDWMRFVAEQCGAIWHFSFPSSINRDN